MKRFQSVLRKNFITALALTLLFTLSSSLSVNAAEDVDLEIDYFAHGAGLSAAQLDESKRLLGIPKDEEFKEIIVNGSDYQRFTGKIIADSSLYSSAVIKGAKVGSGVSVYINTPENITQIKDHQYTNAALTSGITDAIIIVGSPMYVTGESALIGVYKAFEDAGFEINEDATKVATEELEMVNEISQDNKENSDFDSKDFSLAINDMKKQISEIADKGSITIGEINVIINDVLSKNNINISEADKEKLANWLNDFKELDIDWDLIKNELSGLKDMLSKKAGEIFEWGQESGFFAKLWDSVTEFFKSIASFFSNK